MSISQHQKKIFSNSGQGLLETVVALGVIITGLIGSLTLIIATISANRLIEGQFVASNLAREGIEIVRQIRDTNWNKIGRGEETCGDGDDPCTLDNWDDGLLDSGNDYTSIAKPKSFLIANDCNVEDPSHYQLNGDWVLDFTPSSINDDATLFYLYDDTGRHDDSKGTYIQDVTIQDSDCRTASPFRRLISTFPLCFNGSNYPTNPEGLPNHPTDGENCLDVLSPSEKIGIIVKSEVQWSEHSRSHTITVEDWLYNWR